MRQNWNYIHQVKHDNTDFTGDKEIEKAFTSYFWSRTEKPFRFKFNWSFLSYKTRPNLPPLEALFTLEEVKTTTFELEVDTTLKPDGFLVFFFQKYWNVVG